MDDVDDPDRAWDLATRGVNETQQMDRKCGVQLLTGFLLTLPFQSSFVHLTGFEQDVYLATVAASLAATGFLIAPVALHRMLFRRQLRPRMVAVGHRLSLAGLALLGLAIIGVGFLVFDVVAGRPAAWIAFGTITALLVAPWIALPQVVRRDHPQPG